jgi:hypothetical protein
MIHNFFNKTHSAFFQKLYVSFKEYPASNSEEGANHAKGGNAFNLLGSDN